MLGYFNSIKVRLEPEISVNAANALLLFQFHKGAIRTLFLVMFLLVVMYFNSIKVRLEQANFEIFWPASPYFNSIKVRLERAASIKFTAKT